MNIENRIAQMTLEEKVGQLFMLAFSSDRLDEAKILMTEHFVGASYISNDNVPSADAAYDMVQTLQGYAHSTPQQIPLLLGVDQEGSWSVMTPGSAMGPGNMAIGATNNPQRAYEMYSVLGNELAAVGLNMLLAPSADCNSNPSNAIIGMRSFGEDPGLVGAMTAAAVRGAQDHGVVACVKHFPGHGDTRVDSHRGLPTVDRDAEALRKIDLYPFAKGIEAGVDVVMTAHILFPAIDPDHPATLSRKILQGVLRDEMGFTGVIVTDSMNMRSIKRNYVPEEATIQALQAGVDVIMLAEEHYDHDAEQYLQNQRSLIQAVITAVHEGDLSMERIDESLWRVLQLKASYDLLTMKDKAEAVAMVGSAEHHAVEVTVARDAASFLRNESNLLPLQAGQSVTVINTSLRSSYDILGATRGIGPNQTTPAFDVFLETLQREYGGVRVFSAEDIEEGSLDQLGGDVIIAVTENYPLPGTDFEQASQRNIIHRLHEQFPDKLAVLALRDPYELTALPALKTYLCMFSFRHSAAEAAVDILLGRHPAGGASPVSVPGTDISASNIAE